MTCKHKDCPEDGTERVVLKGFLKVDWESQLCAKHKREIEKQLEQS